MSEHGGKRKGAGRPKGAVSKAKLNLADMAKDKAEAALNTLHEIMEDVEQPANARVNAANSILDRAYGKPLQATVELEAADVPEPFTGFVIDRARKPDTA